MSNIITARQSRGRVAEKKRGKSTDTEASVSYYSDINPLGYKAIKNLILKHKLGYDFELYELTKLIPERFDWNLRERYCIETTGQILKIINFIKENRLLEVGEKK